MSLTLKNSVRFIGAGGLDFHVYQREDDKNIAFISANLILQLSSRRRVLQPLHLIGISKNVNGQIIISFTKPSTPIKSIILTLNGISYSLTVNSSSILSTTSTARTTPRSQTSLSSQGCIQTCGSDPCPEACTCCNQYNQCITECGPANPICENTCANSYNICYQMNCSNSASVALPAEINSGIADLSVITDEDTYQTKVVITDDICDPDTDCNCRGDCSCGELETVPCSQCCQDIYLDCWDACLDVDVDEYGTCLNNCLLNLDRCTDQCPTLIPP